MSLDEIFHKCNTLFGNKHGTMNGVQLWSQIQAKILQNMNCTLHTL